MSGDSFLGRNRVRLLVGAVVAAALGVSLVLTEAIDLDKSIRPLIPDSSPELTKSAEILDLAPFSKVLAVQLAADDPEQAGALPEIADAVRAALDPALMSAPGLDDQMPDMERVMALLPALCDDDCLEQVAGAMDSTEIGRRLDELKEELSGVNAAVAGMFWRVDPLGLRACVFRNFPRLTGLPAPDPIAGYPLSDDGLRLLLLIRPKVAMSDTDGCVALMKNLEQALVAYLPAGVSAHYAGGHLHTASNSGVIVGDLVVTMSLAMLLILAIYIFLVKSWAAIWLFLTPAAAVLVATALLSLLFDRVSGLAIGFGAAVLGIAEDYAVHVHFALRRSPDNSTAIRRVLRPLMMSVLLCAGGFGVLWWSAIPAIRQVAAFTILSIVAGYVWAILVLPHCPGMDKPRETPEPPADLRRPHRQACLLTAAALACAGLLLFAYTPKNSSVRSLGYASQELLDDQAEIERSWNLNQNIQIHLAEGDDAETAIALARRGEAFLREASPGLETASLAALWPETTQQDKRIRAWDRFMAERREGFAKAFQTAAVARGFDEGAFQPFLRWFLAPPERIDAEALRRANLGFLLDNFLSEKNGKTYATLMAQEAPGKEGTALPSAVEGIFVLSAKGLEESLNRVMARDSWLIPLAAVICFLVLIWTFRDIFFALLAFIPALAGLCGVLLWLAAKGGSLGLVETAGLPLVVCLGADYGILAVHEFSEKLDLGAAKAIMVSGLTTVAGIGILVLARHPVLHSLGGTVFVGLVAAMAAAILLLPKLCEDRRPQQHGAHDA